MINVLSTPEAWLGDPYGLFSTRDILCALLMVNAVSAVSFKRVTQTVIYFWKTRKVESLAIVVWEFPGAFQRFVPKIKKTLAVNEICGGAKLLPGELLWEQLQHHLDCLVKLTLSCRSYNQIHVISKQYKACFWNGSLGLGKDCLKASNLR